MQQFRRKKKGPPSSNKSQTNLQKESSSEDDENHSLREARSKLEERKLRLKDRKVSSGVAASTKTTQQQRKNTGSKIKLSFHDDEHENDDDEQESKPKLTVKKRKLPILLPVREKTSSHHHNTQRPSAGAYSAEKLNELRSQQKFQLKSTRHTTDDDDMDSENYHDHFNGKINNTMHEEKQQVHEDLDQEIYTVADNDDEGEEEEFISLNSVSTKEKIIAQPRTGRINGVHTEGDLEDTNHWEMEQIKRGSRTKEKEVTSLKSTSSHHIVPLEELEVSIQRGINRLEEAHNRHEREVGRLDIDVEFTEKQIENFQIELNKESKIFEYFQSVRDFVIDLCSCLNEKLPMLDEFQQTFLKFSFQRLAQRTKKLDRYLVDELDEISSRGAMLSCPLKPKIDEKEMGTTTDNDDLMRYKKNQKAWRKKERLNRLNKLQKRKKLQQQLQDNVDADVSSDDEAESKTKHQLMSVLDSIMEDVDEEFSQLNRICSRFMDWKTSFPEIYNQTYCSASLIQIFGVFVRLELLECNFLMESHCVSSPLDRFSWFQILCTYSENQDLRLLPQVLETVFLPHMTEILKSCYQPYSRSQNRDVVMIVQDLQEIFDLKSSLFEPIYETVEFGLKHEMEKFCLPLVKVSDMEALEFCYRQFWKAIQLEENFFLWMNVHSFQMIEDVFCKDVFKKQISFLTHISSMYEDFLCLRKHVKEWLCMYEVLLKTIPRKWIQQQVFSSLEDEVLQLEKYILQDQENDQHDGRNEVEMLKSERDNVEENHNQLLSSKLLIIKSYFH